MGETFTTSIQVRYRDIDPLSHVNHTVYLVYMQQARLSFCKEILDLDASEYDTLVAHLEIDYEQEVSAEQEVAVDAWISDIGSTSFTMAYAISADGERAATGESVQVVVHEATNEATAIPSEWGEIFDRYHGDGEGPPGTDSP